MEECQVVTCNYCYKNIAFTVMEERLKIGNVHCSYCNVEWNRRDILEWYSIDLLNIVKSVEDSKIYNVIAKEKNVDILLNGVNNKIQDLDRRLEYLNGLLLGYSQLNANLLNEIYIEIWKCNKEKEKQTLQSQLYSMEKDIVFPIIPIIAVYSNANKKSRRVHSTIKTLKAIMESIKDTKLDYNVEFEVRNRYRLFYYNSCISSFTRYYTSKQLKQDKEELNKELQYHAYRYWSCDTYWIDSNGDVHLSLLDM